MVFEANTRNKTEHTMWKGMENCARKWCLFLCTILFEVTWPFWKMWPHKKLPPPPLVNLLGQYAHECPTYPANIKLESCGNMFNVPFDLSCLSQPKNEKEKKAWIHSNFWIRNRWTEVRYIYYARFVKCDQPLFFEKNWNKILNYIFIHCRNRD